MRDYGELLCKRLGELRAQKGISARDMSLSIGQSESYINKIENRKSLPAMKAFFEICFFLDVTPSEFFDEGISNPVKLKELFAELKSLDEKSIDSILTLAKQLNTK